MDDVIMSRDNIQVTRTMARFGNTTYPVASIGAVSVEDDRSSLIGLGVITMIGGVIALIAGNRGGAIAVIVIGAGLFLAGKRSSGLKLMLRTSSGNQQAFASTDKKFVQELKQAIETAVAQRG